MITANLYDSVAIIIDYCKIKNSNKYFFIACFKKSLIIIDQFSILNDILSINPILPIYFFSNAENMFNALNKVSYQYLNNSIENDSMFFDEINNFYSWITINPQKNNLIKQLLNNIQRSISAYLIKQGYAKLNNKKDSNIFIDNSYPNIDDFILLRTLGVGSTFLVDLVYHIKKEELFAFKKLRSDITDGLQLIEREYLYYHGINHSRIPKLYGFIKDQLILIVQFINGQTLCNIEQFKLTIDEKITIIFDLIMIIKYLHDNKLVYRDLKPDNVIIDSNKNAYIIDFDRLIFLTNELISENHTMDFSSVYAAPEIKEGKVSYASDIYSIGQMIYYIINERHPDYEKNNTFIINHKIKQLYDICVLNDIKARPTITELVLLYYSKFGSNIKSTLIHEINNNNNNSNSISNLEKQNLYVETLTASANKNIPQAQFNLGNLYLDGKYVKKDITKAIHYLSLAANQNLPEAQYNLGVIYYVGEYVTRNINKSVYYLTQAANQNLVHAQYFLGNIYYRDECLKVDIDKAIYYLTLAANQNHTLAQINLSLIYYENKYAKVDLTKSIHYLKLAANNNNPEAQFFLGEIYFENSSITQDINKAIHYYSLAANQNYPKALYKLGIIYSSENNININKAIHYFTLAANCNIPEAQFIIGVIYMNGMHVKCDISRAFHYLSLALNNNYAKAQYYVGIQYYFGKYVKKDVNQAIQYLTLAANQNLPDAQYALGFIYYHLNNKKATKQAINYLTFAANQNDDRAKLMISRIYFEGKYISRDIGKSIYYLKQCSGKSLPYAQFLLGFIYYDGRYIKQDTKIAFEYFQKSANHNFSMAQFYMGVIYHEGKYIKQNINKAIKYYMLASDQCISAASYNLGYIYFEGKYISQDINKSIHFLLLAAKQNSPMAQYALGIFYIKGILVDNNKTKGIDLLMQSSLNKYIDAYFAIGCLYHEGKYANRNLEKSIYYYKEASSFNNQYAKNNLGVIYKNGVNDKILPNISYSIELFNEAIRLSNDELSIYNLLHIFIYNDKSKLKNDESIKLLIRQSNNNFLPSKLLLCIALIQKYEFNLEKIQPLLMEKSSNFKREIYQLIQRLKNKSLFDKVYEYYEKKDFIYDIMKIKIIFNHEVIQKPNTQKNITIDFYNGFGIF